MTRILLVGGGTGGHVYPLLAVAEELQKLSNQGQKEVKLMAFSDSKKWADEFERLGIKTKVILAGKWRRYLSIKNFTDVFLFLGGLLQSLWHLLFFMPDVIFTKGGHVALPPSLASAFYFIPVVTHESDFIPGLANKIISKFAKKVLISFKDSAKYFSVGKAVMTGNPIRSALFKGSKERAVQTFKLMSGKKTILVIGGSQGAHVINQLIFGSIVELTREFQIIHQTGDAEFEQIKKGVEQVIQEGKSTYGPVIESNYRVFPFLDLNFLADAYALADVVVTRAGVSNLSECAALGKPTIVIPIVDSPADHQKQNALEIKRFGAIVLEEANLIEHIFINQIRHLIDPSIAESVRNSITQFVEPDAAVKIAELILDYD